MWHSNDMFHYMLKAEFVTLVSLKVTWGCANPASRRLEQKGELQLINICCFRPIPAYFNMTFQCNNSLSLSLSQHSPGPEPFLQRRCPCGREAWPRGSRGVPPQLSPHRAVVQYICTQKS